MEEGEKNATKLNSDVDCKLYFDFRDIKMD